MKKIKKYVDMIKDEMKSAEEYAEKYIESKAMGETTNAEKYKTFANQEIEHGMFIHQIATDFIAKVQKVNTPPADMMEKWNEVHIEFIEKSETIKNMLTK